MDTESKHSAQETIQDVDFVQEDLQSKVSKPLVSWFYWRTGIVIDLSLLVDPYRPDNSFVHFPLLAGQYHRRRCAVSYC